MKIYVDVTKSDILRLAKRAGVHHVSKLIYRPVKKSIKWFMETVIKNMVVITEHGKRKTVTGGKQRQNLG